MDALAMMCIEKSMPAGSLPDCADLWMTCRALVSLEEHIVLPTAHSQKDVSQHRNVVPVLGADRGLSGGAERYLIT